MSFWRKVANIFKRDKGGQQGQASGPRVGDYSPFFNFGTASTAMSVSTVYRCVELLGNSVANLPMRYLRKKNGLFTEDEGERLSYLLRIQPDDTKSAFDFWKETITELLLEGNAYIVPIYNSFSLNIDRLVLCARGSVYHDVYKNTYTVNDLLNGVTGTFSEDEIIHLKGYSLDGKSGVSVLSYARLTTDIALAGDNETRNRFVNGGNVRGIINNDKGVVGFGEYQDEELQKTATDIDSRFRNGEHIVSLPGQVDFKQISLSSTDMQFLESRKFNVREICRFFGVHPSLVFDDTSNNYKSAEMANVAFLSNTLNPYLRKIENEFLRKLVAPSLAFTYKLEFDRRGLYACDLEGKSKNQASQISTGLYTVNELRAEENRPPVAGGDKILVSANLKDILTEGNENSKSNEDE